MELIITNQQKLGALGENLVSELFGYTLSEDKFDSEKDMTSDTGISIEVKTQNRYSSKDVFSVSVKYGNNWHQVNKCCEVDKLIFVEYDSSDFISVYECVDRTYETYTASSGKLMAGWPISKMKLLNMIRNPVLAQEMRDLSSSSQFKNKFPN